MALIFELWVEYRNEQSAQLFIQQIEGVHLTLLTGRSITLQSDPMQSFQNTFGVSVWSPELPRRGIMSLQDAVDCIKGKT